jgi:hypothetical protein
MARTDKRPNYGSKRRVRLDGYVDVWSPGHPLARADGYLMEHRLVAWEAGLLSNPADDVHHLDGARANNALSNLKVLAHTAHASLHHPPANGIARQYAIRRAALGQRSCEVCGADITALRIDATVCGNTCRIKRWKARSAACS